MGDRPLLERARLTPCDLLHGLEDFRFVELAAADWRSSADQRYKSALGCE
jgi:hypothetical protein